MTTEPAQGADPVTGPALVEHAKAGDLAGARAALDGGADPAERDSEGWCALDWAAGRGDQAMIELLLGHGADPAATGPEQRTPYQIALAGGRLDAARLLRAAKPDGDYRWRPYCKAYQLSDLRRFPQWPPDEAGGGDDVAFLHDNLSVTRSMWPGEDVLFDGTTAGWAEFCRDVLAFRVPDDLDLVPPAEAQ